VNTLIGREIHLSSRPSGWPTPANFELVETTVPEPGPGQVRIRNRFLSVDPYMRGRMNDVKSYVPPFRVGAVLDGSAVGEVVESTVATLSAGDLVLHQAGWREYAVLDAAKVTPVPAPAGLSPSVYLGALGMPGLTAYVGLIDIAAMRPDDVVYISSAAGAVGSLAGQIARVRGAGRVIGSAGSAAKVRYLEELGFDAAFNYRDAPVSESLRLAAPDGIDVYFDNVGGDHLAAAIGRLRRDGRAALCGAISGYNAESPAPGPSNLALAISKRLTLRGFIITDHWGELPGFVAEMSGWLRDGKIRFDETVVAGIEHTADAFIDVLRGANTGKMVVRLD
jgi:hypothetical protein